MCGLAGIIHPTPNAVFSVAGCLASMAEAMHHRGPDDGGIFVTPDGCAGLANRRLAIRDLSPAGHMPMGNDTKSVWISYNGEIYNTDELRPELEKLGFCFRSHSDTEVILRGYEAWGDGVVARLRGMFAFAILDLRPASSLRLLLARDHLGIKPLYYAATEQGFLFASELKALLATGLVAKTIHPAGLVGYFQLGSVPNPLTLYEGVQALPPASMLVWQDGLWHQEPYWQLPDERPLPVSYEAARESVLVLLQEAVRIRLVSDVPLGAFLSGGIDSSAVVALMRQATNGPIRTCSIAFAEQDYSEASYAQAMAERIGAEHQERVVTAVDLVREFDHILWAMDQPTVDGVNSYFVSQTAHQAGLTVALSGLGGDELFGGYPTTFGSVPSLLRGLQMARYVPGSQRLARLGVGLLPNGPRWQKLLDALARPVSLPSAYLVRRGLFSATETSRLLTADLWRAGQQGLDPVAYIAERSNGRSSESPPYFNWISRAELRTYTHNTLLRDTDVMSMAHSLEVRVPLLDYRLVEAMLRLPTAVKTNGSTPKPLLVAAVGDQLAAAVRQRQDKKGFVFPFDHWLRTRLRKRVEEILFDPTAAFLQQTAVRTVWQGFLAGQVHWSRPWAVAVAIAHVAA